MIKEREITAIRNEAKAEGKIEVVKNLIIKMSLSDEQAADIAEVPVAFVKEIREGLKK